LDLRSARNKTEKRQNGAMSWREGVVYQIYPRSFQDSNGDGTGDLAGIRQRLDHLSFLGVDAVWLSPIYPSPLADFGYDISDYTAVDPLFGSLDDFDALVSAAHERDIRVLLDLVPCHTSIEHPWFRQHPNWYVWADSEGGPPNNWTSAFGGSGWTRDERSGRWYLHSFYEEQPDLDWHNPEVVRAMQDVVRFWAERGVDGFRLDAIDRLSKDLELRDDPASSEPFGLPLLEHEHGREFRHSRNGPGTGQALAALREAAGEALLVGEVYQPTSRFGPYLEHLDRAFVFELMLSPWEPAPLRAAIEHGTALTGRGGAAWVLSNHDFGRLASRYGRENERAAAVLLLTLPGTAFIYQGDEIGLANGPGASPPFDRLYRDMFRHPMQWDSSARGGFTTGEPWLSLTDPAERNVADQREDADSLLQLYRELISIRRTLGEGFRFIASDEGVLAYERGQHTIALNLTDGPCSAPPGEVVIATHDRRLLEGGTLTPRAAAVLARS
jgi:alpha-glucosidase